MKLFKSRFTVLIVLLIAAPKQSVGQYLWQVFSDTVVTWNYQDGDEFSWGIDPQKWHTGFPWGDKIFTQRTYVDKTNLKQKDGRLGFTLKKSDTLIRLKSFEIDTASFRRDKLTLLDSNYFHFLYSGVLLWTKQQYRYGYFELKFKGVEGNEIWPAFWLYGGAPNYEIDFFELKGERPKELHVDVHCPDGCYNYRNNWFGKRVTYGHWVKLNTKLIDNYSVLGAEWTETYVKWYLNGELISCAATNINIPMGLSIGTGINGTDKGYQKRNEPHFPNTFEVDYVRVYRNDTMPDVRYINSHLPQSSADPTTKGADLQTHKATPKLINSLPYKKSENILTISVQPVSKTELQVRVLGQQEFEQTSFIFTDGEKKVYQTTIFGNNESIIKLAGYKTLEVTISAAGKQIRKTLEFDKK